MDANSTLLYVISGATVVATLVLVVAAIFLIRTAREAKTLASRLNELAPHAQAALESAVKSLEESRKHIHDVSAKANTVLEMTKAQLERTDHFLVEATARARVQLDRVELVLDDTVSRVHETVMVVNRGVLRPLKEVGAISAALRAGFQQLLRGGRPSVAQVTTDEEMFI